MPMTLRLKPQIEARAKAHADAVGVSLNALVALALDDYLTAYERKAGARVRETSIPTRGTPAAAARTKEHGSKPVVGPKLGRNDPCWCGSGTKFKRCHGAASG